MYIRKLSGASQAEVTILRKELDELKEIHSEWKERASGKRRILKGTSVITTETIHKVFEEVEQATRSKGTKGKKGKKGKKRKKHEISSESEQEDGISDSLNPWDVGDPEILDRIEVA